MTHKHKKVSFVFDAFVQKWMFIIPWELTESGLTDLAECGWPGQCLTGDEIVHVQASVDKS